MRTIVIIFFLTIAACAQSKEQKIVETPCHKLVAELHTRDNMIWRMGLRTAPFSEELLKQMDRLGAMSIQLHRCATDTPEQFSIEDWKWAVLEASDLQDDLDAISRTFEKMSGEVECDETWIGGSEKNRHNDKKKKLGTGGVRKITIRR